MRRPTLLTTAVSLTPNDRRARQQSVLQSNDDGQSGFGRPVDILVGSLHFKHVASDHLGTFLTAMA